jgi:MOSC domain-containing protein YiiM
MMGVVISVACRSTHRISKDVVDSIHLIAGEGVDGDAHRGTTVKHRSRVAKDPSQPNLRQVHLIHAELFEELSAKGFNISPGQMGENITTRGVDLLDLPTGTQLRCGDAVIELTGLRNPCIQLEQIVPGLMKACLDHDANDNLVRKAGVMGIVRGGGEVKPGDSIRIDLPAIPYTPLIPV